MKWTEEKIIKEIKKAMDVLGVDRLPTFTELRENKMSGLGSAMSLNGGMYSWSKKLNIPLKEKERLWNDEKIKEEILKMVTVLQIDRMPTAAELTNLKRNDLHCIISKTKKYSGWAEELGLSLKDCTTRTGDKYENIIKGFLEDKDFFVEKTSTRHPYDLLVNKTVKIDIKTAGVFYINGSRSHVFHLSKKQQTCDIYILVALDEKQNIERIFVIPSHYTPFKTVSVGKVSKYNKFVEKWDFVSKYVEFFESI